MPVNQNLTRRIEFIDFARGYSILTIVLMHYFQSLNLNSFFNKAIPFGGAGVHLFIFLSGFSLNLSKNRTALDFYKTRFMRVLLPYDLLISLIFLFNCFFAIYPNAGFFDYLGHIFLFKMFNEKLNISFGYHFWFISTIVQFYLIYPLLLKLRDRIGNMRFAFVSLFFSMSWWIILFSLKLYPYRIWNSFFLQFLWEFALGMVLCELYKKRNISFWNTTIPWLTLSTILGIGMMGWMTFKGGLTIKVFNDIPSFVGYTSLCILIYRILKKCPGEFSIRFFLYAGKISYFLYLIHGCAFILLSQIFYRVLTDAPVYFRLGAVFIAFVAAHFFYWLYNQMTKISFNKKD